MPERGPNESTLQFPKCPRLSILPLLYRDDQFGNGWGVRNESPVIAAQSLKGSDVSNHLECRPVFCSFVLGEVSVNASLIIDVSSKWTCRCSRWHLDGLNLSSAMQNRQRLCQALEWPLMIVENAITLSS